MKNKKKASQKKEVPYRVIPLVGFRKTKGVSFYGIPVELFPSIGAIDRVIHQSGAFSPGAVGGQKRPWYMHYHQDDYLFVLGGAREVELFWPQYGRIDKFYLGPEKVKKNGLLFCGQPAILTWKRGVFHRIKSDQLKGSASVNIAVRYRGFNIKNNFNIYSLDALSGKHSLLRAGYLDQKSQKGGRNEEFCK